MDKHTTITTKSAVETQNIGKKVANTLIKRTYREKDKKPIHVVCLYGELGSGKTTFTQGFARALGVTTRLLSPTYNIVRRYNVSKYFTYLYHVDVYRINQEQFIKTGISQILSDYDICIIIEWAEKLKSILPKERCDVYFQNTSYTKRNIEVTYT